MADIGRGKSKHRPRDAAFLYGGKHPFIQTGDVKSAGLYLYKYTQTYSDAGLKQSKLWDENTLCITIAANIAETTILKIKACFPDSIIGLIPYENEASVLFIKHQFDKFKVDVQKLSQGIAQANLNQEKLSNIQFWFPSLVEQQKIASFFSLIDQRIETQNKIIEELNVLKAAVTKRIFSGKLKFTDNRGNDFPKWEWKKLEDIGEFSGGGTPASSNSSFWSGNIPWISSSDLSENDIHSINITRFITESAIINSATKLFAAPVILIVSRVGVGKVAYSEKNLCTSQDFLNMHKFSCNGLFLTYLLSIEMKKAASSTQGTSIKGISSMEIKLKHIFLPCIAEQNKIADFLDTLDKKVDTESRVLQKLILQKQYLLQHLFI